MEDLETKKLRDSLVEYEGYLNEMRKSTLKNVETLDVIQRYTDKSAAGMQKLAEQSLDGIQRVTAESATGLRRIIETGTSNLSRMAEAGESNLNRTAQEGLNSISRMAEAEETNISRITQESLEHIGQIAEASGDNITHIAQECLSRLQSYTETGLARMDASYEKNQETAAVVEKIEQAILEHMESMKELMKQSDDFTHKENVKVYRNVQAVVVDEVKKQTEAMAAQNEELVKRNEALQKQNKGLKPLMIVTLLAGIANIALVIAQMAGLF